tara:strand:+ start:1114 stop:1695 length:582 start_codon:yes stop_codon:yes gene_type:complete
MACTALTRGRGLDCNRISGGVKKIFFSVFDEDVSYTYDGSNPLEIDAIDWNGSTIYEYVMPLGVASITDTITGSRENGTIFYTPTVNIMLNKLSKEDQNEIKLLGKTKVRIFAELNQQLANGHNVFIALGMSNGMELNAGTMDSGASFGDRNGYTLTFDGLEPIPFAFLEDYTTTPWDQSGFIGEAGTFPTTA